MVTILILLIELIITTILDNKYPTIFFEDGILRNDGKLIKYKEIENFKKIDSGNTKTYYLKVKNYLGRATIVEDINKSDIYTILIENISGYSM